MVNHELLIQQGLGLLSLFCVAGLVADRFRKPQAVQVCVVLAIQVVVVLVLIMAATPSK